MNDIWGHIISWCSDIDDQLALALTCRLYSSHLSVILKHDNIHFILSNQEYIIQQRIHRKIYGDDQITVNKNNINALIYAIMTSQEKCIIVTTAPGIKNWFKRLTELKLIDKNLLKSKIFIGHAAYKHLDQSNRTFKNHNIIVVTKEGFGFISDYQKMTILIIDDKVKLSNTITEVSHHVKHIFIK